ncbi:MAG: hypothetical protein J7J31_01790 [Helicobacteraceae bacterium]|nr:hypothetical protein [Helicobacteraceae bacterium]
MTSKVYINSLAFIAISLNLVYAYLHLSQYLGTSNLESKEILLSFAVLDLSWVAILLWFLRDIYARRMILILYTLPLVGLSLVHSLHDLLMHKISIVNALENIMFALAFSSIFILGYFKITPKTKGNMHVM